MTTSEKTKEKPIIFSGEMVKAILEGTKTQTRRVIKPQPDGSLKIPEEGFAWRNEEHGICGRQSVLKPSFNGWEDSDEMEVEVWTFPVKPPYQPGDRLNEGIIDAGSLTKIKPPIHMPRWASRITLEVTCVRVERVQDISQEDVRAEGVFLNYHWTIDFAKLWNSLHAKDGHGWDANPWVWVYSFKVLEGANHG